MAVNANDPDDAIPMNRTKPTTILFAVGAAVLVLGAIGFTFMGGSKKKQDAAAAAAAAQAAPTSTLTPEEHLEITRKSLENFAVVEAERKKKESESKAAEEAKAAPPPPAAGPAPGGGAPAPAPAPAGGGGDAPKPVKKVSKKEASDLDGLKDIASEIGK
jgi:hypothetical protein